ncbi:MAG: hypothetical protein QOH88_1779 [Verrucomicrobiota bacterium]|jgi:23S rRNA maturation mini-RNase III
MTAWRTNPSLRLTSPKDLAEKFDDLGWRRLSAAEQRSIRKLGVEVCQRLAADKARELATILDLNLPPEFMPAPEYEIMRRGKNALMRRIRHTFRVNNRKAEGPKA